MRAYLAEHPTIETEQFPSYTPEVNPDEGVWGYTKYGRLANFAGGPGWRQPTRVRQAQEARG